MPSDQPAATHGSPVRGASKMRAVSRPRSTGPSSPSKQDTPNHDGQSSADQTISGRTRPAASPSDGSGVQGAAATRRPVTAPGKMRRPSPSARSGPQTKQPGNG